MSCLFALFLFVNGKFSLAKIKIKIITRSDLRNINLFLLKIATGSIKVFSINSPYY